MAGGTQSPLSPTIQSFVTDALQGIKEDLMKTHVVTGAFGYSGKYIAERLLRAGKNVRTLTNSTRRANPFKGLVAASPYYFDEPEKLVPFLEGAAVLYNTYWVRFNHETFTHRNAVENSIKLFNAARTAGVGRIVHISITNPSEKSNLEYFRGKARLEQELRDLRVPYSILRPTVLFGKEDILINNIAWALRRLPVFAVFGDGSYQLQPIYVDDLAKLAVRHGEAAENLTIDAIGPETFTYRELVTEVSAAIGIRRPIISVPPEIGYQAASLIGKLVGDTFITRAEIAGLMQGLLYTDSQPTGDTHLSNWSRQHADTLGRSYSSELARRKNLLSGYEYL
jgi:NADH dehydrogenase